MRRMLRLCDFWLFLFTGTDLDISWWSWIQSKQVLFWIYCSLIQVSGMSEIKIILLEWLKKLIPTRNYLKLCESENIVIESLDEVKKKVKNVRDQLRKEYNKVEASKKSGSGSSDIYQPNLFWYSQALFLVDTCSTIKTTSNLISILNVSC